MNKTEHKILVVDDDPIILKVLTNYLADAGYAVTTAENGAIALTLLQAAPEQFSLIILDRMMPVLSGIDLLHKIYVRPELKNTPIIMLTSHAEREDVGAAIIAGVYDFLYKPIDRDLLLLVIKRALRHK
jgi:CheY-like chemotaxis protein